jgi:hypothetical protein
VVALSRFLVCRACLLQAFLYGEIVQKSFFFKTKDKLAMAKYLPPFHKGVKSNNTNDMRKFYRR